MSEAPPPRNHNLPDLGATLAPDLIRALIDHQLDAEPINGDGGKLPSIRSRESALIASCQRFLARFRTIEDEEAAKIATELLSVCARFASDSGRVEEERRTFKAPVLAAARQIDDAFGKIGLELVVRPLTGPVKNRRGAPFTLAEQIANLQIAWAEERDRKAREAAQAEADRLTREADVARQLAARGSQAVTTEDAAQAEAEAAKATQRAAAPMNQFTRTSGNLTGSTSGRRVRIVEVTNAALVPRQYCEPSEKLLRAAAGDAGAPIPEIPGVTIRDVTDLNRR